MVDCQLLNQQAAKDEKHEFSRGRILDTVDWKLFQLFNSDAAVKR